jgi:hypothetical protein
MTAAKAFFCSRGHHWYGGEYVRSIRGVRATRSTGTLTADDLGVTAIEQSGIRLVVETCVKQPLVSLT